MLDKMLEQAVTQVPSLVVLVLVVIQFLKSLKDQRDASMSERKELGDRIHALHQEHLEARSEMVAVLKDVAKSMHDLGLAVATCPLKVKIAL